MRARVLCMWLRPHTPYTVRQVRQQSTTPVSLRVTMEVLSVCDHSLALPLTVYSWLSVIRGVIVMQLPQHYYKYVGSHYALYAEPPELAMTVEVCLLLSLALNATFILYSKTRNTIRQCCFAPVAIPENYVTFLKLNVVVWSALGFVLNLAGGLYLYRDHQFTVWTWLYLWFAAIHFASLAMITVMHSLYLTIAGYIACNYYIKQFRLISHLFKSHLKIRCLKYYAATLKRLSDANSIWSVLLFQTTMCFTPVLSCCIVFTVRPPRAHPLLKMIPQVASGTFFVTITFIILTFAKVELAHRKCHGVLYSVVTLKQHTFNFPLRQKAQSTLKCMTHSAPFTMLDISDLNSLAYLIVSCVVLCNALIHGIVCS